MGRRRRVGSAAFLWFALAAAIRQEQEFPISHLSLLLASPWGADLPQRRRLRPLHVASSDISSAITKWSKRRGSAAHWPPIDGSRRHTKWDFRNGRLPCLEGTRKITKYAAEELNGASIPMLESTRRITEYNHHAAVDFVACVGEPGVAESEFVDDGEQYREPWSRLVAESRLQRAFLSGNDDVTDEGWEALLSPLAHPEHKLARLGLKDCNLDDDAAEAIGESFAKLSPALKMLDLSMNSKMKPDTWTALLYPFTLDDSHLEEVYFAWCNLQDVSAQSLGLQLIEMPPNVKKLNFGGNPRLGPSAWSSLLSPLTLIGTNFKDVSFEDCDLDDLDAVAIRDQVMNMFHSIEVVNFAGNPELTSSGWTELLKSLGTHGNGFGKDHVGVNFGWCDFTDGHAHVVGKALGNLVSGLKRLNFEGNWQMAPDTWSAFLEPLHTKGFPLEEINFGNCDIDAESAQVIAGHLSKVSRSIKRMDFGGNGRLSPAGWDALLKPLTSKSCRLDVVLFGECNLDDSKAKAIGEQLALLPSKVKELDFRGDDDLSPEEWTDLLKSGATSSSPGEDATISSKDIGVIDAEWEKV